MNAVAIRDDYLTGRLSQRVTKEDEKIIRKGAQLKATKLSDYVVSAARLQADMDLADQTAIELNDDAMEVFSAALERPAKVVPQLRKLFSKKTMFET